MKEETKNKKQPDDDVTQRLESMKKLLILIALKNGATSEEIDKATGMGASNIRALFPGPEKTRETLSWH